MASFEPSRSRQATRQSRKARQETGYPPTP